MLKRSFLIFAVILFFSSASFSAAAINLKPRDNKEETKYLPGIKGYTQIMLNAGGGRTLESVEFGDVFVGLEGKMEGGVSYKTEANLRNVPTGGAISLGEVYLDVPNLVGQGNVFRFGRFKVPFGEGLSRAADKKPEMTDPFYKKACFFSEYDFGIQNYSQIKEGSYEIALVNGEGSSSDSSKSKDFAARYIIKSKGLDIGMSEYAGSYKGKNRNNFGLFLKSRQGSLTGLFEYANGTDSSGAVRTLDFYNVITQAMSPKLESVFVYESWDPNIDAAGDHILSYSFGMNLYRTPQIRFSSMARLQKAETASGYSKSLISMVQYSYE